MNWDINFKFIVASIGTFLVWVFGGWDDLLRVLLAFVAIDYLTGVAAAGTVGQLSSSIGFRGIAKKVLIFALVAVAHLADRAAGTDGIFRNACIFFYMANELLSITENAGKMGIPIPDIIKQAIELLGNKSKGSDK